MLCASNFFWVRSIQADHQAETKSRFSRGRPKQKVWENDKEMCPHNFLTKVSKKPNRYSNGKPELSSKHSVFSKKNIYIYIYIYINIQFKTGFGAVN